VQIVGAGFNDPGTNQAWAEQEEYLYEIWTDSDRTLATTYGAWEEGDWSVGRVTVVLGHGGDLLVRYDNNTGQGTHPSEVLEDCRLLFPE
jgi:peroxiredoxin